FASRLAADNSSGFRVQNGGPSSTVRRTMAEIGTKGGAARGLMKALGWRVRLPLANLLRIIPFAAAMVLMMVLWGACGDGLFPEVTSSSSSSGTGTPTPGSGSFFYVTNYAAGNVSEFHRNPSSGALSSFATIAAGAKNGPIGLAMATPTTPYLYVASSASNATYQYAINSSGGGLSVIGTGHIAAGAAPQWVAVTPSGAYAYTTNFGTNNTNGSISQYTIDSSTGALTANTPSTVTASIVHPAGAVATDSFVFVTDQGNEDIVTYSINSNGALQLPSEIDLGAGSIPGPIYIDASTQYVYATDTALGLVYAFAISGSGLSFLGSYTAAGSGTNVSMGLATVITSDSIEYLYVANEATNSISQFLVTDGVGTLTPITTYTTGNLESPTGAAAVTDSTSGNSYLYVTNQANGTISIFSIDPLSGDLTFDNTVSTGASSQPMFPLIAF
ncbi:MAG: beta-propeller fold lactonase family protein, partial [Candidatus Binataceae bacterium]